MTNLKYKITENGNETITANWQESVKAKNRGAQVEKIFEEANTHLPVDEVRREKILKKYGYI